MCRNLYRHDAGLTSEENLKQDDLSTAKASVSNTFTEIFSKLSTEEGTLDLLLKEIWGGHRAKDTTLVSKTDIVSVLSRLKVPCHIDENVLPLLSKSILEAVRTVVEILSDRIDNGLPVEHVVVKPLVDVDADQWKEVVIRVHVKLESHDANREWDDLLEQIATEAAKLEDPEVAASLQEDIGIHFAWVTNRIV